MFGYNKHTQTQPENPGMVRKDIVEYYISN